MWRWLRISRSAPIHPSSRPWRVMAPLGGMERPRRAVRFARLTHRRGRDLGGPTVRAAFGGSLNLTWLLLRVVAHERRRTARRSDPRGAVVAFKLLEARAGSLAGCQEDAPTRPRQPGRWRARRHQHGVTPGTVQPAARVPRSSRSQPSRGQHQRPPMAARSERELPSPTELAARSPGAAQISVPSYSVLRNR
jgi:hypothetical protein